MFNNRMLAVVAVLVLAVPALGAAAPVAFPPGYLGEREQLVEGHTVFTVIEIFNNTTTIRAEFAAAVAVLVREFERERQVNRFPGVLWFNDQYLVNPEDNAGHNRDFRYPCGGAVMAVNQGDEDPRVILANVGNDSETRDNVTAYRPITGTGVDYGDAENPDYEGRDGPDATPTNDADDPTYTWGNVTTGPGSTPQANSDVTTGIGDPDRLRYQPGLPGPDAETNMFPNTFGYNESYLITDPNDHIWIVDKYIMYTRVSSSSLPGISTVYEHPVWVVNILGSPVFIPDDGISSCGPYNDLASQVYGYAAQAVPAAGGMGHVAQAVDDAAAPGYDATIGDTLPWRDNPRAGYKEPGVANNGNRYCYNGNPVSFDSNGDGVADSCSPTKPTEPVRLYNALLYFKLADLNVRGDPRDHASPTNGDTNGCQEGTEWDCPTIDANGDGIPDNEDDNNEGNSHPFHPTPGTDTAVAHDDAELCPGYNRLYDTFYNGESYSNHGGSWKADNGIPPYCDNLHATRNIDIYFSPTARPFAPVYRNWVVFDTQGQDAPFHLHDPSTPHEA